MKKSFTSIIGAVLWLVILSFGFIKLYDYEFKAGPADVVAQRWPAGTIIPRPDHLYQLLMFVHPQCPCTKATLGELESIMAKTQGKMKVYVLFAKLKQFDESWVKSDLFKMAGRIQGVQVMIDDNADQARLFGGTTSGQTFLYDPRGRLVFAGGITSSRGHFGDNAGEDAIIAIVNGQPNSIARTSSFGCLLYDRPQDEANQKRR